MSKLSRVTLCTRFPANACGRDFIVGDLHGHRSLLEDELSDIGFDPRRDRLFAVGDLVDRGPQSLETLRLLEAPWFHAVLGNHELMLLNWAGVYDSRVHSRKAFEAGPGRWAAQAASSQRKLLRSLLERVAALPLAIHVEGTLPFNVTHGDLHPLGLSQPDLVPDRRLCVHEAERATMSRANFTRSLDVPRRILGFGAHPVQLSDQPVGELELTYVGHCRSRQVAVHNSYVYIDQGVGGPAPRAGRSIPPTVLHHERFAHWVTGVAAAIGAT